MCYDWSKDMNKIKNLSYDYIMMEGIFLSLAWVTYLLIYDFLCLRFSSSFYTKGQKIELVSFKIMHN